MPRGGFRPGAGRKRKPRASEISPNHYPKPGAGALSATAIAELGEELIVRFLGELAAVITAESVPLKERALTLKNLLAAPRLLHDAAPGKKEAAQAAAGEASQSGRFATPPPKLAVDNTR